MSRTLISRGGVLIAVGFLLASASANYLFGLDLGRTRWEGQLYGLVGILAVGMNAVAPFFLSWAHAACRRMVATAVALLWLLCLVYSTTPALGFAAQNREFVAETRGLAREAYEDTRRELWRAYPDLVTLPADAKQVLENMCFNIGLSKLSAVISSASLRCTFCRRCTNATSMSSSEM